MDDPITYDQTRKLIKEVETRCPHQVFNDQAADVWFSDLSGGGLTYLEAKQALAKFATSTHFSERSFRSIAPVDILDMAKILRRNANRTMVDPPPPNPDDPVESMRYSRQIRRARARGAQITNTPQPTRAMQQRRDLIALTGGHYIDPSNPDRVRADVSEQTLEVIDQMRSQAAHTGQPEPVVRKRTASDTPQAEVELPECGDRRCVQDPESPRYRHLVVWDSELEEFVARPCPSCTPLG